MAMVHGRSIGRSLPGFGSSPHITLTPSRCSLLSGLRPRSLLQVPTQISRRSYASCKLNPPVLDLPALDSKWRRKWASTPPTADHESKSSKYILPMFPYPSGTLHLGHLRVYTIADVITRFHMLNGDKVIFPMGWDAFGLPAENAAIERGISPATWTETNIAKMKEQLDLMNGSWDWSRELATCDPTFYKHTQKIFLALHASGLAYQAEAEVNYDPVDKTVLANEQVDANGHSWRSGAKVEKRKLKQWFFRISDFRDSLLKDLEVLSKDGAWPERVLAMQRNWLGKSTGATVKFPIMSFNSNVNAAIEVFTSRPDTLYGVQYLALASTHPVVADLAANDPELQAFLDTLPGLPPDSKVGYLLPHIRAVNPLAYHEGTPEASKMSLPVYVAPYVLGDYGEGAVMGVPGHDVRDHAFWKTHHTEEPVRVVLAASEDESTTALLNEPFIDHGFMTEHSGLFKGKTSKETGETIIKMLEDAKLAKKSEKWRLRDWLVSRQRYWGTPIPIVHCDSCGAVPVPDEELPVKLPVIGSSQDYSPGRPSGNPLNSQEDWVNTACPKCNGPAKRDTDTMDTFVDSSWYYMRFIDPHNPDVPFSAEKAKELLPVDLYIGGIEHAILHLLYSRFIYKFLMTSSFGSGEGKESADKYEPFKRLITQGMVHGKTYSDPDSGRFLKPDEVDLSVFSNPKVIATGEQAIVSYEKMSKSKYNGLDPTEIIAQHGADVTRAHMLFAAPVSEVLEWYGEKIVGVTRWLGRLYELVEKIACTPSEAMWTTPQAYFEKSSEKLNSMGPEELARWDADAFVWRKVQETVASVTISYNEVYALNTIISSLMGLTNTIGANTEAHPMVQREAVSALIRMSAPITPAFAEECWSILNPGSSSIFQSGALFPVADETDSALFQPRKQACAVQINGKLRFVAEIPTPPTGLETDKLREWIVAELSKTEEGKAKMDSKLLLAKRIIVVKGGKLVNFVG